MTTHSHSSNQSARARYLSLSFWTVFSIATLLRLAVVVHFYFRAPWAINPLGSEELGRIALNFAAGRGFSSPFDAGSLPTAWMCPFVPILYAGIIKLVVSTHRALWLILSLQCFVGGFSAAMYWYLFRRLHLSNPRLFAAWMPIAVALFAAFSPESLYLNQSYYYLVWQEASLLVFVLAAMRWWDEPSMKRGMVAGLVAGLVALINVTPIPLMVVVLVTLAFRSRMNGRIVRQTLAAILVAVAVISPWIVRNTIALHAFVPLRSNSGFEIFQGNNEVECIREQWNARHPNVDPVERAMYNRMGEVAYCHAGFGRAAHFIRLHPGLTVLRAAERIYISWFTDLTDHWNPDIGHPWWTKSFFTRIRFLMEKFFAIAAVAVFLWGVFAGRFCRLPYAPLFAAIVVLLPSPHYFTLADPFYTVAFRTWLAVLALAMLAMRPTASSVTA